MKPAFLPDNSVFSTALNTRYFISRSSRLRKTVLHYLLILSLISSFIVLSSSEVKSQNTPPVFTSTPITAVDEDRLYRYDITTDDLESGSHVEVTSLVIPSWLKLSPSETSTFAGNGSAGVNDGTGQLVGFNNPFGVDTDSEGNVFVADFGSHKIRKITPQGVVSTLAGSGTAGSTNGQGTTASFKNPYDVAVDASGNVYVADLGNQLIRKISSDGMVSTWAGTAGITGAVDGLGTAASFYHPAGIAIDLSGNLFIADQNNAKIRKIDPSGQVSTFAGNGTHGTTNGPGIIPTPFYPNTATFYYPRGIATDTSGNVYVQSLHSIRHITPTGFVSTIAGNSVAGSSDGQGVAASFNSPRGLVVDASGYIYVADMGNHKIRKISPTGLVSTLAGSGASDSDDGLGSAASFNSPMGLALDLNGDILVADRYSHKIRKVKLQPILHGDPFGSVGAHPVTLNVSDGDGESMDQSFSIIVNDGAPLLIKTSPVSGALNVFKDTTFSIVFDEEVQAGEGSIYLVHETDSTVAETLAVNSQLTFAGDSIVFKGSNLQENVAYSVIVPDSAILNVAGNRFAGILDKTTWTFTTGDFPPVINSTYPSNNQLDVPVDTSLYIVFNESMTAEMGEIYLIQTSDSSVVETFSNAPNVTFNQDTVVLKFEELDEKTMYSVIIPDTAFSDQTDNYFKGITNKTLWSFTTGDFTAPQGYTVAIDQPYANQQNVSNISFTLNDAELGASYFYTLTDKSDTLSGSGTVLTNPQTIDNLNVVSLADTILTLNVHLVDSVGNRGITVVDHLIKDTYSPGTIAGPSIYGMTSVGGLNNKGTIYQYDLINGDYIKLHDFNGDDGRHARSSMILIDNKKLYGLTLEGGSEDAGVLFSYDLLTNTYTKHFDFTVAFGYSPFGSLTLAPDGKLYGTIVSGSSRYASPDDAGAIFSFDMETNVVSIVHDLKDGSGSIPLNGSGSYGSLIVGDEGKLWGMTRYGGADELGNLANQGVIFSYDPITGIYQKEYDFKGTDGDRARGSLTLGGDGNFYGMTQYGGTSDRGVLFSYNPSTHILTKLIDFSQANGWVPYGKVTFGTDGKLYGLTVGGGIFTRGVMFSYDIASNTYTRIKDFNDADGEGRAPFGGLNLGNDGETFYGVTKRGGLELHGVLFSYNSKSQHYTLLHEFVTDDGYFPLKDNLVLSAPSQSQLALEPKYFPENGSIEVELSTPLSIKYQENVTKGTGSIDIYLAADSSLVESIDISSAAVTVIGDSLSITPSVLTSATKYHILIDDDALVDEAGNPSVGISKFGDWSFVTLDEEAPVFTSPTSVSIPENTFAVQVVTATDVNEITFAFGDGDDAQLFDLNETSGVLTFIKAPDFENPEDDDTNNEYGIEVIAWDAAGNGESHEIIVTVTNVDVITSPGSVSIAENTTIVHTVTATGDNPIIFDIVGGDDMLLFDIDHTSGVLTFVDAPDYENPVDNNTNNDYEVEVRVSEVLGPEMLGDQENQEITITVTDVDEDAPVFTTPASVSVSENGVTIHTVMAIDASEITFSLSGLADNTLFDIDATSGVLTFIDAPDFENPGDADTNNEYLVEVQALDVAGNSANQTITITVTDVDEDDPVFTSSSNVSLAENIRAVQIVTATDANAITYGLSGGADHSLFDIDAISGALTFINAPDFEMPLDADLNNVYVVDISATDALGNTANQPVSVTVMDVSAGVQVITFEALSDKTFGDSDFDLAATASSGFAVTYTSSNPAVATVSGSTVTVIGAGTTIITAIQSGNTDYNSALDIAQSLTVNAASQVITFEGLSDQTFGDPDFELAATASSGLAVTYASSDETIATIIDNTVTIVGGGTTTITARQVGDANYNAAVIKTQVLTVEKATQTITFPVIAGMDYGDVDFSPGATTDATGLGVTYTTSDASVAVIIGSNVRISGAGTVTITANQAGDLDYNAATGVSRTFTIDKAGLIITVDADQTKVYGAAEPTFTASYSGFTNGDDATDLDTQVSIARAGGNNIGTYPLTPSGAVDANYDISYGVATTFEVTAKAITVTADAGQSKIYGADDPVYSYAVSPALETGDSFTGSLSRVVGENVGDYAITQGDLSAGTNYVISFAANDFEITAKAITVTADAGQSKVYGAADPVYTYTVSPALETGDSFTGSLRRVGGESVGNYAIIQASYLSAGPNYAISFVTDDFEITEATLTITADNKNKLFNEVNPVLTASYVGFIAGDDLTVLDTPVSLSTTAVTNSPAGVYPITASGATSANYTIDYVAGTLSVGTSAPTITFGDITATYGDSDLTLAATSNSAGTISYSIIGLANGTGLSGTNGEIVNIGNAGTVTIRASQVANCSYSPGGKDMTLTIDKAGLIITVDADQTKVYGAGEPTFTASYAGFANGDDATDLDTQVSIARAGGNNIGTYALTPSGAAHANYDISYGIATTFEITAKAITVTADDQSKDFGSEDPGFTFSVTVGVLVVGDNFSGNLTREAGEELGQYDINVGNLSAGANYDLSFVKEGFEIFDLTPPLVTSGDSFSVAEGSAGTVFIAQATDLRPVSYTLGAENDESFFSIINGEVSFLNSPDFENPMDGNTDNDYVIIVEVSDGVNIVSNLVTIAVTDVDEIDPVFTSLPSASFAENGEGVVYTAMASDANVLTYSLGTGNDESFFVIDGANGEVSFVSSPDFENPTDADTDNTYLITVQTSDGLNEVSQLVTVAVTDIDEINPVFASPILASVVENGVGVVYTAVATDANVLSYSLGTGNDESFFTINGINGEVSFVSSPDFENPTDANTDNAYLIAVQASDGLNEVSQLVTVAVTDMDEIAPTVLLTASTTTPVANTYEVTAEFGEDVTGFEQGDITVMGGAVGNFTTLDASTYTFTVTSEGGEADVSVAANLAHDLAGNANIGSNVLSLVFDITPPAKPVITGITDDTGSSNTDGVTNDANIIISGTAEALSSVEVFTQYGSIRTTQTDANGDWALDITDISLVELSFNLTAEATDLAGNTSAASDVFVLTADRTAPAKPVITGITDDTGSSNTDGVTNDANIIISGTAEALSSVEVFTQFGSVRTTQTDANGDWAVDITDISLVELSFNLTAKAIDLAGNLSATSDIFVLIADRTAPAKPVINSITDDTGSSNSDGVTNDANIIISGTAEALSSVEVFTQFGSVRTTETDANGDWVLDITDISLVELSFNLTAEATDLAGNLSAASDVFVLTADYTAPAKPVITGITDDTGSSNSDGVANDANIMISGTAEALSSVEVFTQYGSVRTTQTDANGDWVLDITDISLVELTFNLTAKATDLAGNSSPTSDVFVLTADYTAPAKPVITSITDDTGSSNSDGITNDSNIIISGTAEALSSVEVFTQFGSVRTTQTDANGDWSLNITDISLVELSFNLTAKATDLAGNLSAASDIFVLIADRTAPAKPVITGITDDTGSSNSDGITNDANIIISGTAEALSSVEVFTQYGSVRTTETDADGGWSLDITDISLVELSFNLTAKATDLAGNLSAASDVFVLKVDYTEPTVVLTAPSAPTTGSFVVTAQFSENVTDLDLSAITVATGTASNLQTVNASTFTFTVTSGNAVADVIIAASLVSDLAGNPSKVSNTLNLDFIIPTSSGFLRNSLIEFVKSEEINLYPNPVSSVLTIDLSEISAKEVDIYMYDAAGVPVFTRQAYQKKTLNLDVSDYTSGIYIVQFYDGQQVIRKKVMVRK